MKFYTLENDYLRLVLSDLGASWLSCQVKFPTEQREVLVTTTPEQWHKQTAYFGATIGRYANRIANGRYCLNGQVFRLAQNNGKHHLHGGKVGADKRYWQVDSLETGSTKQQAVRFSLLFADGEEGFGGEVNASVEYRLIGNQVEIEFRGVSDQDTPLCLTNHAYFNLSTAPTIHQHFLQIRAESFLPVAQDGIPNGGLISVDQSSFDFWAGKAIGRDLLADSYQQAVKGYDHAFQLTPKKAKTSQALTACPADVLLRADDLSLELRTTQPALHLYTGNWLAGQPDLHGGVYGDYAGVAFEPECFPDSPNHSEWWQWGGIAKAGEPYFALTQYRFIF